MAGKEDTYDLGDLNDLDDDLPPPPLSKAEEEELAQINEIIANGDRALINAGIDTDDTEHMDNLNAPLVRPANEERARDDAAYRALMEDLRKRPFKASRKPYKPKKGGSRRRTRSRGNRKKSRRTRRRTRRSRRSRK